MPLAIKLGSTDEMRKYRLWRDMTSEVVCTSLLVFFIQTLLAVMSEGDYSTRLELGFMAGFYVFAFVEAMATFSGPQMNPAFTFLFVITDQMTAVKATFLVIGQMIGSIAGAALAYAVMNDVARRHMSPALLGPGVSPLQGVVCEIVITFSLCFLVLGAWDAKRKKDGLLSGMAAGMLVMAGAMAGYKISGGAMNPAVVIGPAVVTGIWDHHWVYWVGPTTGSALSALVYNLFTLADRLDRSREYSSSVKNGQVTRMAGLSEVHIEVDLPERTDADLTVTKDMEGVNETVK